VPACDVPETAGETASVEAQAAPERIRTFRARRGRTTREQRAWLVDALDRRGIPSGPVDAAALFGRVAPLVLEIGSGLGHAALGYAGAHPEHDLLAVDVHTPGIALLLSRADAAGLTNVRAAEGDALDVLDRLPSGSLDAVHVFFPDPWPKRPHRKRRILRPDVLDVLADRLARGGLLRAATDDAGYAAEAGGLLTTHGSFEVLEAVRPAWRPKLGFEGRALDAGRVVHELLARRG
jgi:tRNA (guanine-N7-)-methyltransferase